MHRGVETCTIILLMQKKKSEAIYVFASGSNVSGVFFLIFHKFSTKGLPFCMGKFIHIGDAHLRSHIWSNIPSICGDASTAISKVKTHAVTNGVDTLILSGDVFHSAKPTSSDVSMLMDLASVFETVLYVEGNHEKTDPPWLASLNDDKFVHLSSKGYYKHGCSFYGIDYVRSRDEMLSKLSEVSSSLLDEYNQTTAHVLVMHAGFQHMINFEGASVVSASDIPDHIDQVLVGHIHKRKTHGKIHSPGPLFPQNWEEVGPCYVDLIESSDGVVSITPIDVTVREYYTFDIADIPEHIPDKSELPAVVRVMTSNPRDVIPSIEGCIVIPKVVGIVKEAGTDIAVSSKTIEEAIMEEYTDPENGALMYELYKSDDPREVINRLFNTHNIERRKLC